MLKGLALDRYYSDPNTQTLTFEEICNSIRDYFEGEEYKRGIEVKWNRTTLKSIIKKSEGKQTEECLNLLIHEL